MPMRSRSPLVLARSIDDAHPNYRWIWERLAGALVPAITPYVGVHRGGSVATAFTQNGGSFNSIRKSGSTEIKRGWLYAKAAGFPPGQLEEHTLFGSFQIRVRGNREGSVMQLYDAGGTSSSAVFLSSTTVALGRGQIPGFNFDSTSCNTAVGARHVAVASIRAGSQQYYIDGVAGATWTQSPTFAWVDPVVGIGNPTDVNLEFYTDIFSSGVLVGRSSAADVARLTVALRSMDPFTWQRRRRYSFFSTAPAPTTTIRPTSDVANAGWVDQDGGTSNLYTAVDDTPDDDATYVRSPRTPEGVALTLGFADPGGTPPAGPMTLTLRMRRVVPE